MVNANIPNQATASARPVIPIAEVIINNAPSTWYKPGIPLYLFSKVSEMPSIKIPVTNRKKTFRPTKEAANIASPAALPNLSA